MSYLDYHASPAHLTRPQRCARESRTTGAKSTATWVGILIAIFLAEVEYADPPSPEW
jgi:hypothetical protein